MTDEHAAPQRNRSGAPRLIGPDVTRAIGLIGVVVMNYHGYLNGSGAGRHGSFVERVFNTVDGPLTTRFAAVFVLVAGVGVTLLTNRSRVSGDAAAISDDRWRLVRRGTLLYACGAVLEWIWPGTVIFYYGALFVIAAALFTLRSRWLVAIGAAATVIAAGVAWFRVERLNEGDPTSWLDPEPDSPRNLLLRTLFGYTHPLFPWLAFFCAGIVLGRALPLSRPTARLLGLCGAWLVALTYAINAIGLRAVHGDGPSATTWRRLLSTSPWDRGVLYTVGTLGSSLLAFVVVDALAEATATAPPTRWLQHAGQMTLTLY
ncbi:MAG TPA: heparan-alpha-glucosaminide N-acetyltransferase domain-containing protein, partial [Ilumatobacteraceae bacterium]|nr:heparan-alpha-glucosaminide N-acetyltransferase domain-containing protein [Ilumatobacteraceae bacterium]